MNEEERGAFKLLMRHKKPFQTWNSSSYDLILIEDAVQAVIEASHPDGAELSWSEFMTILGQFLTKYPADVFDGSSGDVGPRVVCLLREAGRLHAE